MDYPHFGCNAVPSSNSAMDPKSPMPTYLDVRGVGAPISGRVFIATDDDSFDESGSLFESTVGGNTWTQLDIPTSLNIPV